MKKLLKEQIKKQDSKGNMTNKVYNSIIKGLKEAIDDAQSSEEKLKYRQVSLNVFWRES